MILSMQGSRAGRRWSLLGLVTLVALSGAGMSKLQRDVSSDAFVPRHSDALAQRNAGRERFGLSDPLVLAIVGEQPGAALTPEALGLVQLLSRELESVPGVDPERIRSLSTEPFVEMADDGLGADPLLPPEQAPDAAISQRVARGLAQAPLLQGRLAARDLSGLLIAVELRDDATGAEVYLRTRELVDAMAIPDGLDVHIAGQATITGYTSQYIAQDLSRLLPAGLLLTLLMLVLLLRRVAGALLPLAVIVCTLVTTLGLMGWTGVPLYSISSSLPVILISIAVADAIHLMLCAYRRARDYPHEPAEALVQGAIREMWSPMRLTTLTTMAGFAALAISSPLPPMQAYGSFAAVGVLVAWLATLIIVPCGLLPTLRQRRADAPAARPPRRVARALAVRPGSALLASGALFATLALGASQLQFNYERVLNFAPDSVVRQANNAINAHFDGSYYLDVYLESGQDGAMTRPQTLAAIDELQQWLAAQPQIQSSRSHLDILRWVAEATDADPQWMQDADLAQQLLFLYEISAAPGKLDPYITADGRAAYLRSYLKQDNYQFIRPVVDALQARVDAQFAGTAVAASVTGPLHVLASWVGPLPRNTLLGIAIAVLVVALLAIASLRRLPLALGAVLPVVLAVAAVYGIMGLVGIWLDVVTSMFAAIAIGLGVDFGVHMMHALRRAESAGFPPRRIAEQALVDAGWPLTVNALTLAGGFYIIAFSAMPPLQSFGTLLSVAILGSYLAAVLILPAAATRLSRPTPAAAVEEA